MTGYMTILKSNVYNGKFVNGADKAVPNGTLMVLGADGKSLVLPTAADTTSKFVAVEKTTLYDGVPAVTFNANKLNATYYFIENLADYNDCEAYDSRYVETKPGELLRAHPLCEGEEFTVAYGMTYDKEAAAFTGTPTIDVGAAKGVLATGLVG